MKLRAPPGRGSPAVNGKPLAADASGHYDVDDYASARLLIDSFGYQAVDEPQAETARANESALRAAVVVALATLGIRARTDADDVLLAHALVDAVNHAVSVRPT